MEEEFCAALSVRVSIGYCLKFFCFNFLANPGWKHDQGEDIASAILRASLFNRLFGNR